MIVRATNDDPTALALRALVATLSDSKRAERLLALTGLEVDELRGRADDPAILAAVIGFLESHEPDLVDVAETVGTTPARLVAVRAELER